MINKIFLLSSFVILFFFNAIEAQILPGNEGAKHVNAQIIFDRNNLQTLGDTNNKVAKIGVLLTIEEGWHIYWKNPGESGKSTQIDWILPNEWKTTETNWPYPERFIEKGNIKTYAYSKQVLLYSDLIIPPIVPSNETELDFSANISFLVCSDRCIPGNIWATNQILLTSKQPESASKYNQLFIDAEIKTPTPISISQLNSQKNIQLYQEKINDRYRLYFVADKSIKLMNFFETNKNFSVVDSHLSNSDNLNILKIDLEYLNEKSSQLDGVFIFENQNSEIKSFEIQNIDLKKINSKNLDFLTSTNFKTNTFLTHSEDKFIDEKTTSTNSNHQNTKIGIFIALISAFFGGIILNFMPCVLPVLSIKLFGLIESNKKSKKQNNLEALYFTLGIIFSFILLALFSIALKLGGQTIGWGFQFQYPEFVLGMIVFIFILSLIFFDLIQFSLPKFLTFTPNAKSNSHFWKNFFDGLLISTLSTPCTAPFLGTALAFAFTQSYTMLFSIFISIGLGLSAPYFLIVTTPSLHRFFPKPGHWMTDFKHFMGFCLLGTIIWLVYVFESLVPNQNINLLIILFAIGILFWIFNLRKRLKNYTVVKNIIFVLGVTLVSLIIYKYNPVNKNISTNSNSESEWLDFNSVNINQIKGKKFIDFTADWCITCKYNENFVLNTNEIISAFKENNFTKIKADWTSGDETISQALKEAGGEGVPHYIIIDSNNNKEILSTILTKDYILNKIREAK